MNGCIKFIWILIQAYFFKWNYIFFDTSIKWIIYQIILNIYGLISVY